MKLWLDDVRAAPTGWTAARTPAEAKRLLATGRVTEASLDFDLGAEPNPMMSRSYNESLKGSSPDGSGLDVVRWMIAKGKVPARVVVHSTNRTGGPRMIAALEKAGYTATLEPFTS